MVVADGSTSVSDEMSIRFSSLTNKVVVGQLNFHLTTHIINLGLKRILEKCGTEISQKYLNISSLVSEKDRTITV